MAGFPRRPAGMSSDPQAGQRQQGQPLQVIGTDAGGLASLSAAALELVRGASLLAAPSRQHPGLEAQLAAWATQAAAATETAEGVEPGEAIEATTRPALAWKLPRLLASDKPEVMLAALQQALAAGESVVLLASGDPLWFGIGRLLLQHIPPERLRFHPAPTSLQLAFARLGRPWQDAGWVSLHGRETEPLAQRLQQRPAALAVLTDPSRGGAEEVRRLLRSSGLEAAYSLWLAERLGHPQERLMRLAPTAPLPSDLDPLHLVLLIAEPPAAPDPAGLPLFGLDDGLWLQHPDRPGLMTKREVRIQLLADLELPAQGVLWDLGAGVGSIGLEALRLRPQLQLWAVERRGGSAALIQANAERLGVRPAGVLELEALAACAPGEHPSPLPDPDRVLIGGGGHGRAALLAAVLQRLRPGGVVVIPLATVEALAELRPVLERGQLEVGVSQHQAWRGAPLADGTRLAPLNPVLVLKGRRSVAGT
jgi:precorrin-6B C5,15-methyltransferase / cobalt-precorrin-6B C5,C15-methyltransferase